MIKKNCIPGGRRGMSAFWTNEWMNLPKRTQRNDSWLYNLQLRTLLSSNSTLNFQGSIAIFSREPFSPFFISTNIKLRISPPSSNLCPRGKFLFRPPPPLSLSPSLPLSLSPLFFFPFHCSNISSSRTRMMIPLSLSDEATTKKWIIKSDWYERFWLIVHWKFSLHDLTAAQRQFFFSRQTSRVTVCPYFPYSLAKGRGGKRGISEQKKESVVRRHLFVEEGTTDVY